MAKEMRTAKGRVTLMVSSTVYGIEELLEQVYALLTGFGYEVWASHMGTVTVYPTQTALESCMTAVRDCDLFLSIITPRYGSGVVDGGLSITHQELLRAIQLDKPRWVLAHDHVVFARSLFRKLGCKSSKDRQAMLAKLGFDNPKKLSDLRKREELVMDDFRVMDTYDAAIRHDIQVYQDRKGNWVQKFSGADDAKLFATAQFSRYRQVEQFLREHFANKKLVKAKAGGAAS